MKFLSRLSKEQQKAVNDCIDELERRGPVEEKDFLQIGEVPKSAVIHRAIRAYYGKGDNHDSNAFVERVLSRFGCSQDDSLGPNLINGYEAARQILLKRPRNLKEFENLL